MSDDNNVIDLPRPCTCSDVAGQRHTTKLLCAVHGQPLPRYPQLLEAAKDHIAELEQRIKELDVIASNGIKEIERLRRELWRRSHD